METRISLSCQSAAGSSERAKGSILWSLTRWYTLTVKVGIYGKGGGETDNHRIYPDLDYSKR